MVAWLSSRWNLNLHQHLKSFSRAREGPRLSEPEAGKSKCPKYHHLTLTGQERSGIKVWACKKLLLCAEWINCRHRNIAPITFLLFQFYRVVSMSYVRPNTEISAPLHFPLERSGVKGRF